MATATHDDIARLFPGIQDHTAVEILDAHASVAELEATAVLLHNGDKELIGVKRRHGDRIDALLDILSRSEIRQREGDRD